MIGPRSGAAQATTAAADASQENARRTDTAADCGTGSARVWAGMARAAWSVVGGLWVAACAQAVAPGPVVAPPAGDAPSATSVPPVAPVVSEPAASSAATASSAVPSVAFEPGTPLRAEVGQGLAALRPDPPPRAITRNEHYLVSDERKHYLFRDAVGAAQGGVLLGVGAEQNWLIAGWSHPEVMVLLDFDQWVVDVNDLHALLLTRATSPDDYLEFWSARRADAVRALIAERFGEADRARVRHVFDTGRGDVARQLADIKKRYAKLGVPSYLDDAAQFAWVAALARAGRVRAIRGNLVDVTTLADVATWAKGAGLAVRVLYLSNAEGYFDWNTGAYRSNLRALPYDAASVVLHTKPHHGTEYRYLAEPATRYVAWLASDRAAKLCELFDFAEKRAAVDGSDDAWTIAVEPDAAPPAPARRCRKF